MPLLKMPFSCRCTHLVKFLWVNNTGLLSLSLPFNLQLVTGWWCNVEDMTIDMLSLHYITSFLTNVYTCSDFFFRNTLNSTPLCEYSRWKEVEGWPLSFDFFSWCRWCDGSGGGWGSRRRKLFMQLYKIHRSNCTELYLNQLSVFLALF